MVKIDFNKKGIKLYNADCFDVFKNIKDKSIDLFVLDLPFGSYGGTSCKWDNCLDLKEMWINIKRIMKPETVICFFCNTKFGYQLIKSNEKWFKYDLIYAKSRRVGFLSANRKQLRAHENIYIFKNKQGIYNAQKTQGEKPYKTVNKGVGYYREKKGDYSQTLTENKGDRYPTSIIDNTILKYNSPYKTIHQTEKPVGLLEYLIKTYSNEGDLIMDFTMGSASCGIACYNTKRKFIGIEKDDEIYKLAKERIIQHIKKI